ncbi:hypothetical protein MED222_05755 [Vibrio sp. MED222]|nr:hypothetical protein MED222_05755 [Vibrio sp. MED222]
MNHLGLASALKTSAVSLGSR